jgi:hypothetical protein
MMALGIPLPGLPGEALMKGINTGSNMFANLMHPILQREQQKQLEEHFKQELALRKAQFARSGANSDLTRQLLQQQLLHATHANDPNYEFNQFQALQDKIMGDRQSGTPGVQQMPQETPHIQPMGEGMGMFSPEGMQEAQQPVPMQQAQTPGQGGINLEAFKQNPMLRGFFKHKFGYDPLVMPQTPEEKQASAIDLYKKKADITAANKSGDTATNKVLTQNQQAVQAIDTVLPMVDEFINNPGKVYGPTDFRPSKKAAYNAKTGGMIDLLVAAQSLPQVKESVKLVEDQIRRQTGESTDAYIKRLEDFKKDLTARRGKAIKVVKSKKVDTTETAPNETKTIGGVKYEKINGEWHEAD